MAKGGDQQRKMKETRSVSPGVNGLHTGDIDREMGSQPLKASGGDHMLRMMLNKRTRILFLAGVVAALFAFVAAPASADMAAAKKWVDEEFQPSTLTKEEQMKEMEWFINAAAPFKGMHVKVVS